MLCSAIKKIYKAFLQTEDAFTLIEMLITIAILAVVIGVGFLNLANYKNKNTFDLDAQNVLEAIRNGENKALLGAGGTGWGIKFTSDTNDGYYEIFSGSSYATSSVVTRETLTGSTLFANPASGFSKTITFAPLTGVPSQAESVVLKRSGGTDRYLISLSTLGSLDKVYEQGLVGYWPLDEGLGTTAYDASGGGNNGTITGATWQNVSSCRIGECLSFNGSSYVDVPAGSLLNLGTGSATITIWFETTASGAMVTKRVASGFQVYVLSGDLYADGAGTTGVYSSVAVNDGKWHFGAVVYDRSANLLRLYVDGTANNTVALGSTTLTDTANLEIGRALLGGTPRDYFNGSIDDVRIYNRALSATEIQQMYQRY